MINMHSVPAYTLIIPTFNRADLLARLLRSLERQGADFPILILDSGDDTSKLANRATVKSVKLSVRHLEFDSSMQPFDKFSEGATTVTTPFCSMCADDDLVMVSSLAPLVATLAKDPTIAVAHGWYFTFYMTDHFGLTSVVYKGSSVTGTPMDRVRSILRHYEAVTYGVYRTEVMARVLDLVRAVPSILFREVGAGALTAASGSTARLPVLYYGRALGASQNYSEWHPIEFLIGSPQGLFREYEVYRTLLANELRRHGVTELSDAALNRLLDLYHLRYLSDYMQPRVVDHVIDGLQSGQDRATILQTMWPLLQPSGSPLWDILRSHPFLQKVRDKIYAIKSLPRPLLRHGAPSDEIVKLSTATGTPRTYRLYGALLGALAELDTPAPHRAALLETMGTYE